MGNLKDVIGMIPGIGKAMKDVDINDDAFKGIEAIIYSMTPKERSNPDLLEKSQSRKLRIARGSGKTIQEVSRMLKQFDQTRKMMRSVAGAKMPNIPNLMKK
jgi:signal recognition particle subunit SRP54